MPGKAFQVFTIAFLTELTAFDTLLTIPFQIDEIVDEIACHTDDTTEAIAFQIVLKKLANPLM